MWEGKLLIPEVLWSLIAIVGGMARTLSAYIDGGQFRLSILIANGFVSGFSGYMFAETMQLVSADYAYVAAGVGGYYGTQALDWIVDIVRNRFRGR